MKIFAFLHKKMGTFLQNLQRMSTLEVYFARNVGNLEQVNVFTVIGKLSPMKQL